METTSTSADIGSKHLRTMLAIGDTERNHPPDGLEQDLRRRFPTEDEYDLMLSRKLESRRTPVRQALGGVEDLAARLDHFLDTTVDGEHARSELRWLSGGGSKMQIAFDLETRTPLHGRQSHALVIRVEPIESLSATSRLREAQLIGLMKHVVPVPEVYWVDEDGSWFGQPALIYTFVEGVAKPRGTTSQVGGVGGTFEGQLRTRLADQFVEHIARVHSADIDESVDRSSLTLPRVGTTDSALWQVNRARRVWEEDRGEDLPYVEAAALWLVDNVPRLDRVSVLHGDYRTGNFLFDEASGNITAWLDWERGYLGDRHRDLAWITLPQWGKADPDTGELLVSGLIPLSEFEERYQELSGLRIDPARMHYYRVLNSYQLIVSSLGTAHRVAQLQRSHQDVLLTSIEGLAHSLAHEMRNALLEEN